MVYLRRDGGNEDQEEDGWDEEQASDETHEVMRELNRSVIGDEEDESVSISKSEKVRGWDLRKMIKILLTSYDSENHWENRWGLGERVNNPWDAAAK